MKASADGILQRFEGSGAIGLSGEARRVDLDALCWRRQLGRIEEAQLTETDEPLGADLVALEVVDQGIKPGIIGKDMID